MEGCPEEGSSKGLGSQPQFPSGSMRAGSPSGLSRHVGFQFQIYNSEAKQDPGKHENRNGKPGLSLVSRFSFLSKGCWEPREKASEQAHLEAIAGFYSPASITLPSITLKLRLLFWQQSCQDTAAEDGWRRRAARSPPAEAVPLSRCHVLM